MTNTLPTTNDRQLESRVMSFLQRHRLFSARQLTVRSSQGLVTLSGEVPSFYLRQLCVECSKRVAGVVRVVDRIRVCA